MPLKRKRKRRQPEEGADIAELDRQYRAGAPLERMDSERGASRNYKRLCLFETWQKKGILDERQAKAAERFRDLYETALSGAGISNYSGELPPDSYASKTLTQIVLEANSELAHLCKHIGMETSRALHDFCVYDDVPKYESRWKAAQHQGRIQAGLIVVADFYRI